MGTIFIVIMAVIVTLCLIIGMFDSDSDLSGLFIIAIAIVLIFAAASVYSINKPTIDQTSKIKVNPNTKIVTEIIDGKVKTDTTYTYTFLNE